MAGPQPIELSELIENLRDELLVSKKLGEGRELRFDVAQAQIEVQFTARRDIDGKGKIKLYVVEAGGGSQSGGHQDPCKSHRRPPNLDLSRWARRNHSKMGTFPDSGTNQGRQEGSPNGC